MSKGQYLLRDAQKTAEKVLLTLQPFCNLIAICGSIRRRVPVVGDIDIIVAGLKDGFEEAIMELGASPSLIKHTFEVEGISCDVSQVVLSAWGAALMHHTGSKAENIRLRKIAKRQGYSLSQYGLKEGENIIAGATEMEVYEALGVTYQQPEER